MASKPITIIGGGLAGLTLGIGLRQKGIPVTLWESGHYPRHKACGEFISGRGRDVLEHLDLLKLFREVATSEASTARFLSAMAQGPLHPMSPAVLCVSRFTMDNLLAREFRAAGGELQEGQRWQGLFGDGVVRATGRRPHVSENGWTWFGLKVHARNVALTADLELHCLNRGYIGLCRLPAGETNVCGLFRRRHSSGEPAHSWQQLLRGPSGSLLNEQLARAVFDETSFCSVAGLSLAPQRASALNECCIGDALTMIPPVTGNGMSMAFEAAELAIDPLVEYSRGALVWQETRRAIARACDTRFAARLTWASWLQKLMFMPGMCNLFATSALRSEWLWRIFFTRTR